MSSLQLECWQTVDILYLSAFNPIHETQVPSEKTYVIQLILFQLHKAVVIGKGFLGQQLSEVSQ